MGPHVMSSRIPSDENQRSAPLGIGFRTHFTGTPTQVFRTHPKIAPSLLPVSHILSWAEIVLMSCHRNPLHLLTV